jgi:hypothetical protein
VLHPRRVAGDGGVDSILQFWSRDEAMGRSIDRTLSGDNELILAPWE